MIYELTVAEVSNPGTPSVAVVRFSCRLPVMGNDRTFDLTLPVARAAWESEQAGEGGAPLSWPPCPGDVIRAAVDLKAPVRPGG